MALVIIHPPPPGGRGAVSLLFLVPTVLYAGGVCLVDREIFCGSSVGNHYRFNSVDFRLSTRGQSRGPAAI
jgi:hypothetical protein